jgi:hypothetical protein
VNTVALIGLMKMELPTRTVRLCDGGFIEFNGETYRSADDVFGTIASLEGLGEGVGDEVPALEVTFYPHGDAAPGDLSQPGFQTSRVRLWIAEYDVAAGTITGTPDLVFDGQLDRTALSVGQTREVSCSVVSLAERLFELNIGNSLNPNFHKSVWPGEQGHDNATGLSIPVAWGTTSPPTSARSTSPYYPPRNYRETPLTI